MSTKHKGLAINMMSKPDSEMDGTICKECKRLISDHLPEELEECIRLSLIHI